MQIETAADIASLFVEEEFAEAAVYLSPTPGAEPLPCVVILDRGQGRGLFKGSEADRGARTSERHLWAMAGDADNQIPDVRRDGIFTINLDGEVLKVAGMPRLDHLAHLWSVELVAA